MSVYNCRNCNNLLLDPLNAIKCHFCNSDSINYCSIQCRTQHCTVHAQECNNSYNDNNAIYDSTQMNHGIHNDVAFSQQSHRKQMSDFVVLIDNNNNGVLGKGAYGEVKLVQEITTGMEYALKILEKKELLKFESIQNVKREIKIQKRLNHPHIIKLITFFEDKANVYLQLEYAECGTLFHHLKTKKCFSEKEAFVFFFQTCLGIDYLHKNQIIHRDLKPENLLLDSKGNIKLCDFGWSAEYVANAKRSTYCGTLDYMAPEMLKNQNYDYTVDIWSLGILLYELLHGYPPFQGSSNHEKCQNILTMKQIPYKIGISPECQDLIKRILQFEPRNRLSMQGIFEHDWMLNNEKIYGMVISSFVWTPEQQRKSFIEVIQKMHSNNISNSNARQSYQQNQNVLLGNKNNISSMTQSYSIGGSNAANLLYNDQTLYKGSILKMGKKQQQIQTYLNDTGQNQNILEQDSVSYSPTQQEANTNAYNHLRFDNQQNTFIIDNEFDYYKNQKASVNISDKDKEQDKEEEGFWHKILVTLGCATKRYK